MSAPKPSIIFPTPEEEQQIAAGIASDPVDFEIDEQWIAEAMPAAEFFGKKLMHDLTNLRHHKMLAISDTELNDEIRIKTCHPLG